MRNFEAGQNKLEAKFDLVLEKVIIWRDVIV